MPFINTLELYKVAEQEGIVIEEWDFPPPLEAVYWNGPGLPPVIGLSNQAFVDSAHFRCVLAEELGHHFTTVGSNIAYKHMNYGERLQVSKIEYKALRWAAEFLMPIDQLIRVIAQWGYRHPSHIAELFSVTADFVKFRLQLPDIDTFTTVKNF